MCNIGIIINCLQGGGAERCAADLSCYFEEKGYHVIFFTDLDYDIKYKYRGELVDFTYTLGEGINSLANKIVELRELKDRYKISISISFMQFANYINILSKKNEKVILTTHSVNSEYAKTYNSVFWSEHTFKVLYQYADAITFPSEYCRNDWIEHYGDSKHITKTVYNPVHLLKRNKGIEKHNYIITVGRMEGIKRQWHIIKAFKLVTEELPDSKLIILGDGILRGKLEKLINRLGLQEKVEMPGNVSNVQEYLYKSKIFVLTSHCEAMPIAMLEALSAGVPVISCDSPGGIKEILGITSQNADNQNAIQGECGIITPYVKGYCNEDYCDAEKILAREIIHLMKDNQLQKTMSENATKRVEKFLMYNIGELWLNDIICNMQTPRRINRKQFEEEKKRSLDACAENNNAKIHMYISYYRLLEKWMLLHENGISIKKFFENRKMSKIIVYGLGKMMHHLFADLKDTNITIVSVIDKGAIYKYEDFPVLSCEEEIPPADSIVVTPIYDYEIIREELAKRTNTPIFSLADIIDECY